ncbi:gamma-tubulin complex component 4-like [Cimex lectularius]|uniref:Gamma-tubulin complex component n=1 Tax=Cimex lectularius TaxID=79782 RepID=A0A8I6SLR2_CIMLE|nr:gamma-tubulin complex component 4-like [Cimex lectularius]
MVFYELLWSIQRKMVEKHGESSELATGSNNFEDFFPDSVRPYMSAFAKTADCYREIAAFLDSVDSSSFNGSPAELYLTAFGEGVQEIVDEFVSCLCDVEVLILEDEDFSPISIGVLIEPVADSLEGVLDGIKEIRKKRISGCPIIDLCYKYAMCGPPNTARAYQIIIRHCMYPFFKQTKMWMFRSELFDPHLEFFIEKSQCANDLTGTRSTVSNTTANFSKRKEMLSTKYSISLAKLPEFLPYSIAAKILFIGETLLLCQKDSTESDSDVTDKILEQCGLNENQLMVKMEEIEKSEHFSLYAFDTMVTDIWNCVDKFARKLAEAVGGLRNRLVDMRDIYLLGRGELFQEFLVRANHLLTKEKPSSMVFRSLKVQFKNSFYYVYRSENLDLLESINFTVPRTMKSNSKMLDLLQIDMKIRWPLDSLFTPFVMDNYNKLFKFLLRLKRAQMDILEVWTITNVRNELELQCEALALRNNLVSLVGNLQNYCFFDVIAKEMNHLMQTVDNTETFFAIQSALGKFQENILHQLFIFDFGEDLTNVTQGSDTSRLQSNAGTVKGSNRVYDCINTLFSICHKYSLLVKDGELTASQDQIRLLSKQLNDSIGSLVKLVKAIDNSYSNSYLQNLMLSLDYNGFFSRKESEVTSAQL